MSEEEVDGRSASRSRWPTTGAHTAAMVPEEGRALEDQ